MITTFIMETVYSKRLVEIKREHKYLERMLKVKISVRGRLVTLEGEPLDEYAALQVFEAINTGFSARTSTLILDENFVFEKLQIKDYTKRKDLEIVRGRIIGTHGRTKHTIQQISGCEIKIQENTIGIIGPADRIQYAITAITNIIRGSKQGNAYKYLERINAQKRRE